METSLDQLSTPTANSGQAARPSEHRALESHWRWYGSKSNFWLSGGSSNRGCGMLEQSKTWPSLCSSSANFKNEF